MNCSRCGRADDIVGSLEYFGPSRHRVEELCSVCDAALGQFLTFPSDAVLIDDSDDISLELVHAEGCPCGQCDADIRWEARRDNAAA